ncbi:MAG: mercury methylation corrinoid protein HgcA [Carboxydocellales bacterium]
MAELSGAGYSDEAQHHYWVEGYLDTPIGQVRRIKTTLTTQDKQDGYKARWGINRYNYTVSPGLYAVGNPDNQAPILVTANYKLTFDALRKQLGQQNLWLMVLDTKGINVWCAAGKGTFGTTELISRIKSLGLDTVVTHRRIIIPQLGAPGVAGHEVFKHTGFKVVYGPVRAEDIGEFLANNQQTTPDMRVVKFTMADRLILTPMEIVPGLKFLLLPLALLLMLNLLNLQNISLLNALQISLVNFLPYLGAFLMGTLFTPLLLPYIPFRSFALKGLVLGVIWAIVYLKFNALFLFPDRQLVLAGNTLLMLASSSFLALNFTGSSTYTSLSGTLKETIITVPLAAFASLVGVGLLVADKILSVG